MLRVILVCALVSSVYSKVLLQDFFKGGNELYCDDEDREHNYMNLGMEPAWSPNPKVEWAVLCYGATGEDDELPLSSLTDIYLKSARNLRAAAPKLTDVEFWNSQTFDGSNSTEDEIIDLFQHQYSRALAEAKLVTNSALNQGFTITKIVSQFLIQVRCDGPDTSARCRDPMSMLQRAYDRETAIIDHFEAFLKQKLENGVEFNFFATYLVRVRQQRVFSGLLGSTVRQTEEDINGFGLFKQDFF
ncbi:unnamed protein product [Bursaphelenchus okinawaensis]|uniref:Uncharacterized protein n=1 Tax=Bursaphelenchus okinawaensis TaxID=465554 RepID=A0A811JVU3_9BILA|nr:unnamed protein product [Bursaphelenchus okinawaensis]CAG9084743.1 unnamed protein product [Bursaphelenchus okinawaensis]